VETLEVKPDASVKPDGSTVSGLIEPDEVSAIEIAAVKAELQAEIARQREIDDQSKLLKAQKEASKIVARHLQQRLDRLRAAEAEKTAATRPALSQLEALRLFKAKHTPPKADPETVKANKKGRDDRYLAKVAADPIRAEERRKRRNEAQNRRRRS
jgi:hypothetical protein